MTDSDMRTHDVRARRAAVPRVIGVLTGIVLVLAAVGCADQPQGESADPAQVDSTEAPDRGACRTLVPDDLSNESNASKLVDCTSAHTAETFLVGKLPVDFDEADYDSPSLAAYASQTCASGFTKFLNTDESTSMRSIIGWFWFRPSRAAWSDGARWLRCDAAAGSADSPRLIPLPNTVRNLLEGGPQDKWMACVDAPSVSESPRVPCSEPHTWRAVTTIKLGDADGKYPGDAKAKKQSKDFCSGSVDAWLGYPEEFDFGYTWFGASAWKAGNRHSICWARTNK
ncbi:MAG: septum formation family protein [Nocardioides sp.]